MPHSLIILSQSDSLIQIVDINSDTKWQTVQIQSQPTDLDLHCLQRQGIYRAQQDVTRVKDATLKRHAFRRPRFEL